MMKLRTTFYTCLLIALLLIAAACRRSAIPASTPTPENTSSQSTPEPTPKTQFERDLLYVRKSNFQHVWLFARKDGKVIDKDDAAFLRTNAPQVVDWVTTDGGTKVLAGTNFDLEQAGLNLIRKRFAVEDYTGK